MLKLRRGTVVEADPLTVEVAGTERRAWADGGLVGPVEVGDEVIVNTGALDLGLGSGGFDIVHVNLTRGLSGEGQDGAHVVKLNYTSLQHAVEPVEPAAPEEDGTGLVDRPPLLALPLHGHLAPAAWAAGQARPGLRVGFVQCWGGALPGALSRDVAELRERGLLCGHVTAGPAHGAEYEAISLVGAVHAAASRLGWEAIACGPGPGIVGSASRYGHGGMAAFDAAHAGLALGLPTIVSPRLSASDPRARHRGLSHHTAAVLAILLAPVRVPVPEVELAGWPTGGRGGERPDLPSVLDALHRACEGRHDVAVEPVDLEAYAASGLPSTSMGRTLEEDPLFFAAPLAAGRALAAAAAGR